MFRNMLNTLVKLYQLFAQIKQTTIEDVCGRVEFIHVQMHICFYTLIILRNILFMIRKNYIQRP